MQKRFVTYVVIAFVCSMVLISGSRMGAAEEGGSGHYFPGSMASFMDAVSPTPAFILRYNQIYYSGSVGVNKPIPIAGSTAFGLHATTWGEGATIFWRPNGHGEIPSKHWSYGMSMTIPFLQMDVNANAVTQLPPSVGGGPVAVAGRAVLAL